MPLEPFQNFSSTLLPLRMDDVDTDQIIPARFLIATGKGGYGENLFRDLRFDAQGKLRMEFPLNNPQYKGANILLAHKDFGSGSSREHAVWALVGYGFKAVIAITFGDIFKNNCYKNGLLPIALPEEIVDQMHEETLQNSKEEATINLNDQTVRWKGKNHRFDIEPFIKTCLCDGVDEIGYILKHTEDITAYEEKNINP
ncbi:MAG: 3-isopropylmalate dehydratase small subunit [Patescibacteria group bacterium]